MINDIETSLMLNHALRYQLDDTDCEARDVHDSGYDHASTDILALAIHCSILDPANLQLV